MQSKIMVDLMDGIVPCIRIERGFDGGDSLPDKVLRWMFQELIDPEGNSSPFLGIERKGDCTYIYPLSIDDAKALMEEFK